MNLELTAEAAHELRRVILERSLDAEEAFLRVGIEGGGASYSLDLTNQREPGEEYCRSRDLLIACASRDLGELEGARIDYRREAGAEPRFVVDLAGGDDAKEPGDTASGPTAEEVWRTLKLVDDPEVGVNIVDLGLVYAIEVDEGAVRITMTLTTPACPLGDLITEEITYNLSKRWPSAPPVEVSIVWDPPWSPEAMSPEAKMQLGWRL